MAQQPSRMPFINSKTQAEDMAKAKSLVRLNIPERQPFETNATKKQKEYLWNLGVRDTAAIEKLGKAQASAAIDQLKVAQREYARKANAGSIAGALKYFSAGTVICGIWAVLTASGIAAVLAGLGVIACTICVVAYISA